MKKTHYRQGDVLIERIANIPTTAAKQKRSKRIILAHGEVTGHHHALEISDPADWWKEGEIASSNNKPRTLAGELFIDIPDVPLLADGRLKEVKNSSGRGAIVTHPEHRPIVLTPGNYRVTRQREYSPEAIRNVKD
jgi:hypothetical protein